MSYTDRNGKVYETVRSLMEAHGFHFDYLFLAIASIS